MRRDDSRQAVQLGRELRQRLREWRARGLHVHEDPERPDHAWDDAPEATVAADGTVSWPVMSNDDTLEDGVTYTVSFNVKPTQAAFDEAVKNHKDDANPPATTTSTRTTTPAPLSTTRPW